MTAIVCVALSAVGLVLALLTGFRGRIRTAIRWFAVALVPVGLYLTGLITVFDRIGRALGSWGTHLVFDPRVWAGLIMLGAALLILFASGIGRGTRSERRAAKAGRTPEAAAPATAAAKPVQGKPPTLPAVTGKKKSSDDDFSDIEEILKRRGI